MARRIEKLSSDIKRQLGDSAASFDYFSLACDESTDASDTAQFLIFLRGVDDDMNVTEEMLDLKSLKGQTRGSDLFLTVCSAVDDLKLPWSKVSGIVARWWLWWVGVGDGVVCRCGGGMLVCSPSFAVPWWVLGNVVDDVVEGGHGCNSVQWRDGVAYEA